MQAASDVSDWPFWCSEYRRFSGGSESLLDGEACSLGEAISVGPLTFLEKSLQVGPQGPTSPALTNHTSFSALWEFVLLSGLGLSTPQVTPLLLLNFSPSPAAYYSALLFLPQLPHLLWRAHSHPDLSIPTSRALGGKGYVGVRGQLSTHTGQSQAWS